MWYFAVAGLVGGSAVSLILWGMQNPDYRPAVPGHNQFGMGGLIPVFAFPPAGAALGAFWAWVLESKFGPKRVGVVFGCAVATLSFVALIVVLAAYGTMNSDSAFERQQYTGPEVFWGLTFAYTVFGGVLFGWALVILGGITGWLARRHAQRLQEGPRIARTVARPVAPQVVSPDTAAGGFFAREKPVPFSESPLQRAMLGLLEVPLAFGVAYAVLVGVGKLYCRTYSCADLQLLGAWMVGLPTGVVVGIAYWIVAIRMGKRLRRRLVWDSAALMLAIAAYVIPQIVTHFRMEELRAQSEAADRQFAYRKEMWIEALKKNAHGPPGEVPPMLDVVDEGDAVTVTNKSARGGSVALAKVIRDATGPGGWRGCLFVTEGRNAYHSPWLVPGEKVRFVLDPKCAEAFAGAPIEYRVGDGPSQQGWWSDSAFATPEGRRPVPGR